MRYREDKPADLDRTVPEQAGPYLTWTPPASATPDAIAGTVLAVLDAVTWPSARP